LFLKRNTPIQPQDMTDRYDSPDLPHGARYRHEIRVRSK